MLPLDGMTKIEALKYIENYSDSIHTLKVGMEMFYKEGKAFILSLKQKYNKNIFLDLKIHDIPKTALDELDKLTRQYIKSWVDMPSRGATHAILHSAE